MPCYLGGVLLEGFVMSKTGDVNMFSLDCTKRQSTIIRNADYMDYLTLKRADTRFNWRMHDFSKGQRFIDITEDDKKGLRFS